MSRRLALAVCLALLSLALLSPAGYAQEAAPTPTASTDSADSDPSSPGFGLPDPRQWVGDALEQAVIQLLNGVSGGLKSVVQGVLDSPANVISQTPPALTYDSPTVQALRAPVQRAANAALLLVAIWGGLNLMVRQRLGAAYHDVVDLLPRLAGGAVLVNTSGAWVRLFIDANNALCAAVGAATPPGWGQADAATQTLAGTLAALAYLLTALLLVIQMLLRLALLDVLLIVAPLGLLCWVLPQTQGWSRLWTGTFTRAVFTQFVQVVALKLGASLLTELQPSGPLAASGLLANVLGVAALLLALKVPGLLGSHGGGSGLVQYAAYRYGAAALAGRLGRRRPAADSKGVTP